MSILKQGSTGSDVKNLQQKLKDLGFDPNGVDGHFGPGTEKAVRRFQKAKGLDVDGQVGPKTRAALQLDAPAGTGASVGSTGADAGAGSAPALVANVTVEAVAKMFPGAPVKNIQDNLPVVLQALNDAGLGDKDMILMALATIRAETGNFTPLSEFQSKFNTPPGGPPFSLYDNRSDLGNQGPPDGANFRGRGFIQLTGRANFLEHGQAIGLGNQLIENPKLANEPEIAAKLLASFLKAKEQKIRNALAAGDLKTARKLVNGGSHGLGNFTDAFNKGKALI